MKKSKLFLLVSIITVLLVGVASVAYAAVEFNNPAEIVAGLTGKSIEDVTAARQAGNSYGEQAIEAGKQAEFQAAKLDLYKQRLDQAVTDKRLTQEEADKLYEAMKTRIAECDGTCTNGGLKGSGQGLGNGTGRGMMGGRMGSGRMGSGSCVGAAVQ